ncbi:hypothetical protein NJT12_07725 [Flavobacterium sp. AC]|uniref:Lipoprotein n=1 Tax=Flavobacterium azizsancarii TaxID=2961580 RepID=A0ABT4WAA1_9FLAO|nr:hypothetical protein [Flavobacterium azizsancarii]MDA6069503.1 hypothetical protein [Flavobacterium azizsancarii]
MKKQITLNLLILLAITVQSCTNKKKTDADSTAKNVEITDSLPHRDYEDVSDEPDQSTPYKPDATYPKKGNKIADFLPKTGIYEVQYETEGDLNNDGFPDIAVVLKYKENNISKRPMLILLQNKDKSYRLDKVSNIVMPIEYNEADYKIYDTEDITIENGGLNINLYSIGPGGNIFGSFKYFGNDFILNMIEAEYRGAGGHTGLFYNFEKGDITINETNTMKEDEPTESKTTKAKVKRYLFEKTSITNFFNED